MRIAGFVVLGLTLCGSSHALESSAGADNVNSSQLGIVAKVDASNAILQSGLNQILACNHQGKFFDSTTNICEDPTEPLAKKIAACTTNKQFYNQTTEACQDSAPDLTNQLNTTNSNLSSASALLQKVINCNNNQQFYNSATGACQTANGTNASTVLVQCQDGGGGSGGCNTAPCPGGYSLSGCSYGVQGSSAYTSVIPLNNGCSCNKSHGSNTKFTCTAYCVK